MQRANLATALTIAGSDSGGGAGIQADLKVFASLGVFGTSSVTAITAQNPERVTKIQPVSPPMVAAQIHAVFQAFDVRAAKCGMLGTASIVEAVADELSIEVRRQTSIGKSLKLVMDPILRATSGTELLESRAWKVLEHEGKRGGRVVHDIGPVREDHSLGAGFYFLGDCFCNLHPVGGGHVFGCD